MQSAFGQALIVCAPATAGYEVLCCRLRPLLWGINDTAVTTGSVPRLAKFEQQGESALYGEIGEDAKKNLWVNVRTPILPHPDDLARKLSRVAVCSGDRKSGIWGISKVEQIFNRGVVVTCGLRFVLASLLAVAFILTKLVKAWERDAAIDG